MDPRKSQNSEQAGLMTTLSIEERARTIERLIWERDRVAVEELALLFGTSAVTIRQDLTALEVAGRVKRVRGGAVRPDSTDSRAFDFRARQQQQEKEAIAERAAALVQDGDALMLDCGTTAYYLARRLRGRQNLIVFTNGLRVAQALSENPTTTVIMPGGTVHATAQSLVGSFPDTLNGLGRMQRVFFCPWAVSTEQGYLDINAAEADMKRKMIESCDQAVALFDSTRASHFAFIPFAGLADVHMSISDSGIPASLADAIKAAGQEIVIVEPERVIAH
jgi:DeoR/GlpR family transcriptional regulator of sugar metabolism